MQKEKKKKNIGTSTFEVKYFKGPILTAPVFNGFLSWTNYNETYDKQTRLCRIELSKFFRNRSQSIYFTFTISYLLPFISFRPIFFVGSNYRCFEIINQERKETIPASMACDARVKIYEEWSTRKKLKASLMKDRKKEGDSLAMINFVLGVIVPRLILLSKKLRISKSYGDFARRMKP